MHLDHLKRLCDDIREDFMGHDPSELMWNETCKKLPLSFIGIIQVYTEKTETNLNSNNLVAYPIHIVLFNLT